MWQCSALGGVLEKSDRVFQWACFLRVLLLASCFLPLPFASRLPASGSRLLTSPPSPTRSLDPQDTSSRSNESRLRRQLGDAALGAQLIPPNPSRLSPRQSIRWNNPTVRQDTSTHIG